MWPGLRAGGGGTLKLVVATCSTQFGVASDTVLLESASNFFPKSLLVSPVLVQVQGGTVLGRGMDVYRGDPLIMMQLKPIYISC